MTAFRHYATRSASPPPPRQESAMTDRYEKIREALADLFGPNEDFDGLVSALEDEASK